MMQFIMVPLIFAICVSGVYGLFELFARRQERLKIIDKIGEKLDASAFDGKLNFGNYSPFFSFSALKAGCLMAGVGLGLLVGFIINASLQSTLPQGEWFNRELAGAAYGASVLLFGGISLIIAFIIELKIGKKDK